MFSTLSIVIPVYNEEATIIKVLHKITSVTLIKNLQKEIILIDDCSTDDSAKQIISFINSHPSLNIQYHKQSRNFGKGAAIRAGIKKVTGEIFIIQDADLEYDPHEYNRLLKPIIDDHADVVYGSRFIGSHPHRILFFWHSIGNKFLTFLSNMFTNLNLTDMETCYKMFRTEMVKDITICESRFGFEPEITAKIARIPKLRLYEVGISYYGRTYEEGKKINWKDGFRAIYCIVKYGLLNR